MDLRSTTRNLAGLAVGLLATWVVVDTGPMPPPRPPAPRLAEPPLAEVGSEADSPPAGHEDPVAIEVLVILASKDTDEVDPQLDGLIEHLRFTRYRGFVLRDRQGAEDARGRALRFAIDGGHSVEVVLVDHDAHDARVRMQMWNRSGRKQLDTTVQINRNKRFMVAGPKVGDGVLILPVAVRW